jgi:hypothetical protein
VVELGVVQGDDRLVQRRREAGVEGGVPLPVFVAAARVPASIRSRQSE